MQSSGYIECKSFLVVLLKFEIKLFEVLRLNLLKINLFIKFHLNKTKNYTCKLEL